MGATGNTTVLGVTHRREFQAPGRLILEPTGARLQIQSGEADLPDRMIPVAPTHNHDNKQGVLSSEHDGEKPRTQVGQEAPNRNIAGPGGIQERWQQLHGRKASQNRIN